MQYIEKLKSILDRFAEEVRKQVAIMDQAQKTLQPQIAEVEVRKSRESLKGIASKSAADIRTEKGAAIQEIQKWGVLRGDQVNSGDMELLSGHFNLTGKDLADLVDRHRNNATMLRAISDYYEHRKGEVDRETLTNDSLFLPAIPTVESKIQAVERFFSSRFLFFPRLS